MSITHPTTAPRASLVLMCCGDMSKLALTIQSIGDAAEAFFRKNPEAVLEMDVTVLADTPELAQAVADTFSGVEVHLVVVGDSDFSGALAAATSRLEGLECVLFPGDVLLESVLDQARDRRSAEQRRWQRDQQQQQEQLRSQVPEQLNRLRLELPQGAVVHPDTVFEGESVIWSSLDNTRPAHFGAFSFTWSPVTSSVVRMGRYCSIAADVIFGPGQHPLTGLSTSSFMYMHHSPFVRRWREVGRTEVLPFPDGYLPDDPDIRIGNDVWIGTRACIKEGVTLGDGCIVGTNAVVTKDVPPYAVVAGVPARIVRYRFDEALVARMLDVAWWQYDFTELAHLDLTRPEVALDQIEELRASGQLQPYLGNDRPIREIAPGLLV